MTPDPKPPTCGDCESFDEQAGDDNRPCLSPLPFWVSPMSPCWPWRGDERAKDCRCFKRKADK